MNRNDTAPRARNRAPGAALLAAAVALAAGCGSSGESGGGAGSGTSDGAGAGSAIEVASAPESATIPAFPEPTPQAGAAPVAPPAPPVAPPPPAGPAANPPAPPDIPPSPLSLFRDLTTEEVDRYIAVMKIQNERRGRNLAGGIRTRMERARGTTPDDATTETAENAAPPGDAAADFAATLAEHGFDSSSFQQAHFNVMRAHGALTMPDRKAEMEENAARRREQFERLKDRLPPERLEQMEAALQQQWENLQKQYEAVPPGNLEIVRGRVEELDRLYGRAPRAEPAEREATAP